MPRAIWKPLTLSLCGIASTVGATPDWLKHTHGEVENCDALPGVYVHEELDLDARTVTYMTGTTCADLEDGWFVGPYTYEGLENTMPTGGITGMYQVRSEGTNNFDLRMLGVAQMNDFVPFPFTASVFAVNLMAPPSVTGIGPTGTPKWSQGNGYLYDPDLPVVEEMTPGLWFLFPHIRALAARRGSVEVKHVRFGGTSYVAEVGTEGVRFLNEVRGWEDLAVDLKLEDGGISGEFSMRQLNPLIPDARGPDEYAYADVEITEIFGRAIDSGIGGMLMVMGTGTATLYDEDGQSSVMGASLDMHAVRVPDDRSEEVMSYFQMMEQMSENAAQPAPADTIPEMDLEGMGMEIPGINGAAPGGVPKWGD